MGVQDLQKRLILCAGSSLLEFTACTSFDLIITIGRKLTTQLELSQTRTTLSSHTSIPYFSIKVVRLTVMRLRGFFDVKRERPSASNSTSLERHKLNGG
jgi:hypothetical protein